MDLLVFVVGHWLLTFVMGMGSRWQPIIAAGLSDRRADIAAIEMPRETTRIGMGAGLRIVDLALACQQLLQGFLVTNIDGVWVDGEAVDGGVIALAIGAIEMEGKIACPSFKL